MSTDLYKINLKSLKDGEHKFEYFLDTTFFQAIEDTFILDGEVDAEVTLVKRGDLHQVNILVDGYVSLTCDRCLAPLEEDVYSERDMIVKLGAEYIEESDEVLILPEKEGVFDLSWLLYEDVVLSLPMQRMHEEGGCNQEMLSHLTNESSSDAVPQAGVERDEDGIDLRWSALKALRGAKNEEN